MLWTQCILRPEYHVHQYLQVETVKMKPPVVNGDEKRAENWQPKKESCLKTCL